MTFHRNIFFFTLITSSGLVFALYGYRNFPYEKSADTLSPAKEIPTSASAAELSIDEIRKIPQPTLKKEIKIPLRYPEFYRESLQKKIQFSLALLKQYPYNTHEWNTLAIYWKAVDDFSGAAEIWEYLLKVSPNNSVYLGNLGELYQSFIKDYPKAERYYLEVMKSNPARVDMYRNLHDLYKYLYKTETNSAIEILKDGLAHNKNNLELLVLLANDYKERGFVKEAKVYYNEAIKAAEKAGRFDLAKSLEKDLSALK